MTMNAVSTVASDWIAYQRSRKEKGDLFDTSDEKELYWWAVEQFMAWTRHDPELCWATIVEIWHQIDHNDLDTLALLGAGELEDLLCNYGDDYFPVIEKFCHVEPDFKTLLRMVWQNSMSLALWQRVQDLRGGPNL
jgi:hypothetical protein